MALKVGELFASFDLDSSGMNATLRTIENSMESMGANMVSLGSSLQASLTAPIESFARQTLSAGMDFTAQMSTVEAISGATAEEMERLNAEALKMGSTTQFTATQAGEALEYMAMAGWETDQMLAGLAPIMNLAAAGGEDLGSTSDIVTDALTAFGLEAEDAAHFADILAVASSSANTNVSMMGETFKYVAPVAGALGYTAEDVAVAIGLMANSGIKAGQAGTVLRAALSRLSAPTDEAQEMMNDLGLSITDASGQVKPFSTLLGELRTSFSELTKAEQMEYAAEIFGQEAMSGMLALINASDEDVQKLTESIENCGDATQRMADTVLNNAKGDWTLFESAVEGAQVALFKLNETAIRSVIQGMTALVDRFNGASDASKQAALKLSLVAAAMGPALVFGGKLLLTLSRLGVVLGAMVSPVGLAATGLALFALAATDADNDIGKLFVTLSRKAKTTLSKLDGYVQSAVKSISARMPALISSIRQGISTALPQLVTTALDIVTSLAEMIGENADGLLSIGTTIIRSIAEGIGKSIPNIAQAAVSVVTGIVKALRSGDLFDAAVSSAKSIISGFKAVDWTGLGGELLASMEDVIADTAEKIKIAWTKAKDFVLSVNWSDVAETIKKKITFANDWLKNKILGDAASDKPTWGMVGRKICGWIKASVSFASNWLKGLILGDALTDESSWKDVGSKVWGWIQSGFSNAQSWLKNLILGEGSEGKGWSEIGDKIVGKISESLSAITPEKMTEKIGDLSAIATTIIDKIVSSKADFAAAAGNLVANFITSLSSYSGWDELVDDFGTVASQVVSSLTDAIGKVAGAGASIAGAIGGVLGSITLEDVTTATATVSGLLIDGIAAGLKAVVGGAASIAGAIATVLSSINDNDWGESIGTLATDLFKKICTGICEVIETPDMSKFMENVGKGIKNAVASMGDIAGEIARFVMSPEGTETFKGLGKSIIGAVMMGMAMGIGGLGDGLIEAIHSILDGAVRGILERFGVDEDFGFDAFYDTFFESATEGILSAAQLSERYLENGIGSIVDQAAAYVALMENGFGDQLAGMNLSFSNAGIALFQALQSGMLSEQEATLATAALISQNMATGLEAEPYYKAGEDAVLAFVDAFGTGEAALLALCSQLGIEVPESIAEAIDGAEAWTYMGDTVSGQMNEAISAASSSLYDGGKKMVQESVIGGIADGAAQSQQTVQDAADSIMNTISGLDDRATIESDSLTTGQTAGQAIGEGVSDEEANAQTAVDTLVSLMNTSYQPLVTGFGETTRSAMLGVCNGVNAMSSSASGAVRSAMNAAVSAAKSIMNSSAGYSLGQDMMQGLVSGIRSMSGTLASAARSAVSSAIAAMRQAADAHSPSRETLALGEDMDEGGALGLSGGLMAKAAQKSIEETIRAFTKGAYVTDLSVGTVATSRQAARQNAEAVSETMSDGGDTSYARTVGTAIAERLIASGALSRRIVLNGKTVGEEVAEPVSQTINRKSKQTISGRSAQGVIA